MTGLTRLSGERPSRTHRPVEAGSVRLAWVYDFDGCKTPTGVTRHALAQLDGLAARREVDLRVISGRMNSSEGLMRWNALGDVRRAELPVSTRNALRFWRVCDAPAVEWWSGAVDWVYSPSDYMIPTRGARRAVTCHDILQDLRYGSERRRQNLARTYERADLILSVSRFNTERFAEAFPQCRDKVELVPNAAEDLFFDPAPALDRANARATIGLPPGMPYLLSVANFQPRKNLPRLVRAVAELEEVRRGELALVLLGEGDEEYIRPIREAIANLPKKAIVTLPGYRQGTDLRAIYAEAEALVFPSLCESFGIPTVEAMAQGTPIVLANNTALPEIGAEAGWYFEPESEPSIATTLRAVLDNPTERRRRTHLGQTRAARFRWSTATDRLLTALRGRS
ncbi:MAG: glycosyltransferase family 1 protein [Isosphaeraceae bacterium]|nr:glycosyltransferase family 1 protein [Isosphaeraceae bacterium]